jgi:hypothetical protein
MISHDLSEADEYHHLMSLPTRATALGLQCVPCQEIILVGTFTQVEALATILQHVIKKHSPPASDNVFSATASPG